MWFKVKTTQSINILIVFLMLSSVLFNSCKKKNSEVGLDIIPESDRINLAYTDTISLDCFIASEDSLISYGRSVGILGYYSDPVFGTSESSFLFQTLLSAGNVVFDDDSIGNPVADSLVLYLKLNSYYGDAASEHNLKLYRLDQSISTDSVYYSNINTSNYYSVSDELCSKTISAESIINNDSILRLTLPIALATEILETDSNNLIDNDTFLEFFKGMYIAIETPTGNPGSIINFDILLDESKMMLYYHDTQDTSTFDFVITTSSARINSFKHDYIGSVVEQHIDNNISTDSVIYVQGLGGVRTKIKFPYINNWRALNGITINKAELIMPIEELESSLSDNEVPEKLYLVAIEDDNTLVQILDDPEFNTNNNYFGGTYSETEKNYKINITRYYQGLIAGDYSEKGVYIFPFYKAVEVNRAVLKGNKHTNGLKLAVTYIKL